MKPKSLNEVFSMIIDDHKQTIDDLEAKNERISQDNIKLRQQIKVLERQNTILRSKSGLNGQITWKNWMDIGFVDSFRDDFVCKTCDMRFKVNRNLIKHYNDVHVNAVETQDMRATSTPTSHDDSLTQDNQMMMPILIAEETGNEDSFADINPQLSGYALAHSSASNREESEEESELGQDYDEVESVEDIDIDYASSSDEQEDSGHEQVLMEMIKIKQEPTHRIWEYPDDGLSNQSQDASYDSLRYEIEGSGENELSEVNEDGDEKESDEEQEERNGSNYESNERMNGESSSWQTSYTQGPDYVYCNICLKQYQDKMKFRRHYCGKHIHLLSTAIKCDFCDYRCNSDYYLEEHMRKHSGDKPFTCISNGCQFRTHARASLINHYKMHHAKGGTQLLKFRSDEKSTSQNSSLVTFSKASTTGRKRNRQLRYKYMPWQTHFIHLNSDIYQCKHCEKQIQCVSGLESHYNRIHNRSALPFQCRSSSCDFGAFNINEIQRHEATCEILLNDKGFVSDSDDETNVRSERKRFKPSHWEDHEDAQASTSNQTDSGNSFISNGEDFSWLANMTITESGNHLCNACNKQFEFINKYKRHYWVKHNRSALPHKCPYDGCSYGASRPGRLDDHIRSRHTNENPFNCKFCRKKFPSKAAMRCHISNKHHK